MCTSCNCVRTHETQQEEQKLLREQQQVAQQIANKKKYNNEKKLADEKKQLFLKKLNENAARKRAEETARIKDNKITQKRIDILSQNIKNHLIEQNGENLVKQSMRRAEEMALLEPQIQPTYQPKGVKSDPKTFLKSSYLTRLAQQTQQKQQKPQKP